MVTFAEFERQAPTVAEVFRRRHAATGHLCLLGTLMKDGSPRICPIEPAIFDGELWLVGMEGTTKFADLARDPRFTLHTATEDTQVSQGDAKLSGSVHHVPDLDLQQRWAENLFSETGFDLREATPFSPFYAADLRHGSCVRLIDQQLIITVWRAGQNERDVIKR